MIWDLVTLPDETHITPKPLNQIILIFNHFKLCLATAIHNFKCMGENYSYV